ncbi:unnamed protein product [Mucor hiemalis]
MEICNSPTGIDQSNDKASTSTTGGNVSHPSQEPNNHPSKGYRILSKPLEASIIHPSSAIQELKTLIDRGTAQIAQLATAQFGSPEYLEIVNLTTELDQRQHTLRILQQGQQQHNTNNDHTGKIHQFVPPQLPFVFQ